jgi:rod shape-determining protein MreC
MASNAEVEAGDLLVTSGLDGMYPRGLPVARVAKVERDSAFAFAKIVGHPVAGTTHHQQVLVLSPATPPPAWAAEPDRAKRGARAKRSVRKGE